MAVAPTVVVGVSKVRVPPMAMSLRRASSSLQCRLTRVARLGPRIHATHRCVWWPEVSRSRYVEVLCRSNVCNTRWKAEKTRVIMRMDYILG